MRLTTSYHGGNDIYRPVLQNYEDMQHNYKEQRQIVKEQSENRSQKHYVKNKGFNMAIEEIKQRRKAKTTKFQKYDERNNQFAQTTQKLLFEKIEGKSRQSDVKPNAEESRNFWSNIWSQTVEHNESTEWISEVKESVSERRKTG